MSRTVMILVVGALLVGGAIGYFMRGSPGSPPGEGPAKVVHPTTAAGVAQGWVEGVNDLDLDALVELCNPVLAGFFEAVSSRGHYSRELIKWCGENYPPTDGNRSFLRTIDVKWRQPLSSFKDLKLDGRLRKSSQEEVFQISYSDHQGRPQAEELVVVLVDGEWVVNHYGRGTPSRGVIGAYLTVANKIRHGHDAGIAAMEKEKPPSMKKALEVYGSAIESLFRHQSSDN